MAQSLAGWAALMGAADGRLRYSHTSSTGTGLMVKKALGSKEEAMALFTRESGGSSGSGKVNAVGLVAALAFTARASVVL